MQLEIFCLCVKNEIIGPGLPCVIGIFDRRTFDRQPCVFPPFVAVACIRIFQKEFGKKHFDIVITGPEGEVGRHSEIIHLSKFPEESKTIFVPYTVPQLVAVFGTYWFSVESPEGVLGKVPLYVTKTS